MSTRTPAVARPAACTDRRTASALWLAALAGTLACAASADVPAGWSPELAEAFALYDAGQYAAAQERGRALGTRARSPVVRFDAEALEGLAMLRDPSRSQRLAGRSQIARLAQQDPTLLERPDVLLAGGVAHLALDETADALSMLLEAARRFEAQGEWLRLGAAYLALAETWTKFGEWEALPQRLGIGAPQTAADGRRTRREQIERLRTAAAQRPVLTPTAAAIDLLLARWLLDQPDGAEEGEALLARLAAARPMNAAAADAALTLAARYEQQRRWPLALDLYEAAAAAPDPQRARRAAAARDEIRRPAIHPEFAEVIAPGAPAELRLRTRNLHDVRVELRRVDLGAWLEERRGIFAEAALPTSGAVVFTQTLDTPVDTPFDWWRGGVTTASPLPPGAYVVQVSGRKSGGAEQQVRRLLLASQLRGVGLAGRDQGVVWAYADAGGPPDLGERATAAFWMAGTYVPARPEMRDGVAAFSLPDERLALRDRRWVALLASGEHLALCRGQLPPKQPERDETARVLLAGASRARAGDEYTLFGLVHEPSADAEPNAAPLTIDLVDGDERIRASQQGHLTHAGTFLATLRLPDDVSGEILGAIVRRGGRVIENARGRFVVQVASGDDARLELAVRGPRHMRPDQPPVLDVLATYPWGLPRADMRVNAICRALAPGAATADDLNDQWARAGPIPTRAMLDARGRARLLPPFGDLAVSESATVYGVWLTAIGWDTRVATASMTVLSEPGPLPWALPVGGPPRVGEPMAFSVGFHDVRGIVSGPPTLEVRHGDTQVADLRVNLALDGWRSERWTPTSPGAHEAVVRLRHGDTEAVRRYPFEVAGWDEDGGWMTCISQWQAEGVRVELRGTYRGPLLAAVLGGEPLAARALIMAADAHELLLPAPRAARHARVVVIVPRGGTHQVVVAPPPMPDEEQTSLDVRFDAERLRPASSIGVEIECAFQSDQDAPPDVIVTARLVLPEPDFGLPWAGGEPRPAMVALAGDVRASFESAGTFDGEARGDALERFAPVSDALVAAFLAGPTSWVDSRIARDGRARFEIPLPGDVRQAILVVTAQTRADELVTRVIPLALDAGLSIVTDSPPEFFVGDRTVISARAVSPRAASVRLRLDPGPGLRVESVRARPETAGLRPVSNDSFEFVLSADAPVSLVATVEAVTAARGRCAWVFEGPEGRQAEVSDYVVRSVPPPATAGGLRDGGVSAGAPVRIRRVLTVLERPRQTAPDDPLGPSEPATGMPSTTWPQTAVGEHTRLRPGDLVLVREEVEVLVGLQHVRWEQAVPAHGHVSRSDPRDRQDIGRVGRARADRAEWTARELPAGAYRNEYVLAMMRPGACILAAPTVVADGVSLEVVAESVVLVVENP